MYTTNTTTKITGPNNYSVSVSQSQSQKILSGSRLYPTSNFGHQHNTYFINYDSSVNQGINCTHFALHQVQIKNNLFDRNIQVLRWHMRHGRIQDDFRELVIRPGLFYTARLVPNSWGKFIPIEGAVVFRIQGTQTCYTLAFRDPFHQDVAGGPQGNIIEGYNPLEAIASLKDSKPKQKPFGKYYLEDHWGTRRTVFEIHDQKKK